MDTPSIYGFGFIISDPHQIWSSIGFSGRWSRILGSYIYKNGSLPLNQQKPPPKRGTFAKIALALIRFGLMGLHKKVSLITNLEVFFIKIASPLNQQKLTQKRGIFAKFAPALIRFGLLGFLELLIMNIEIFFIKNRGFSLKSAKASPKKGYFYYKCTGSNKIRSCSVFYPSLANDALQIGQQWF